MLRRPGPLWTLVGRPSGVGCFSFQWGCDKHARVSHHSQGVCWSVGEGVPALALTLAMARSGDAKVQDVPCLSANSCCSLGPYSAIVHHREQRTRQASTTKNPRHSSTRHRRVILLETQTLLHLLTDCALTKQCLVLPCPT
jgi:hypothetical protein